MTQNTSLAEVRADIKEMREQMAKEHRELRDRVIHLEYQNKVTRWFFSVGGAAAAIALRELIPRIL